MRPRPFRVPAANAKSARPPLARVRARWGIPVSLLLATTLLAGCGGGDGTDGPTFTRTCPAWEMGRSSYVATEAFQANTTTPMRTDRLGAGNLESRGLPLDFVTIDTRDYEVNGQTREQLLLVRDGRLDLRLYRGDTAEELRAFDQSEGPEGQRRSVFSWGEGEHRGFVLQVELSSPGDEPRPDVVRLEWTFVRDVDRNPDTPSEAYMLFHSNYWYRQCGAA